MSASPEEGGVPLLVVLSDAGSSDPDGEIVSIEIDAGDPHDSEGFVDCTGGGQLEHLYTHRGGYNARLRVTDSGGKSDTARIRVRVRPKLNAAPIAVGEANPASGPAPLQVEFSASGSYDPDGTLVAYEWDFGTGAGFQDFTPNMGMASHTYSLAGNHSAVLRITDDDGAQQQLAVPIEVAAAPPEPWVRTWGGAGNDVTQYLALDGQDNSWSTGNSQQAGADHEAFILQYSPAGELLRKRAWGGSGEEIGFGIACHTERVCVVGSTTSSGAGGKDGFVLMMDADGDLLWQRCLGTSSDDSIWRTLFLLDGSVMLAGFIDEGGPQWAAVLCRLSADGNLLWSRKLEANVPCVVSDMVVDGAGLIRATGYTQGGPADILHIILNDTGNVLSSMRWGGLDTDAGLGISLGPDGESLIAGMGYFESYPQLDAVLLKLTADGELLSAQHWDGGVADEAHDVVCDADGNVALVGSTNSFGILSVLMLQLDPAGDLERQLRWNRNTSTDARAAAFDTFGTLRIGANAPNPNTGVWESVSGTWLPADHELLSLAITSQAISLSLNDPGIPFSEPVGQENGGGTANAMQMRYVF